MGLDKIIALQQTRMKIYDDDSRIKQDGVFDNFERNPSYRIVEHKDKSIGVHVIDDGIRSNIAYRKVIAQPPIQLRTGDYISIANDDMWLCVNEDDLLYNKTAFALCNKTIKWIDKSDILIEKPCIVSAKTLYTTGVKDEKIIQIPDGMVGIQLPYDEDTQHLNRDDAFVFNKAKYVITFYNEVEFPGLLILICQEKNINHALDDPDNEIANRWDADGNDRLGENTKPPELSEGTTLYSIDGNDKLRNGQTGTYVINKTIDGVEADGVFAFEINNKSLANITETNDNTCQVKANTLQTGEAILVVSDLQTNTQTNKIIQIIPFM